MAGIRDALGEIGMESATFQLSLSQLEDKCPLPAILHWEQNHFVVIYKITRNKLTGKRTYHIANPAYGKHGHDLEAMQKSWLNGKNLVNYSAKSLREQCGIVMQDNFVFSDTIRQNIIFGEPYDSKRFDEAVRMACLTEFIDKLPLRDFTKIGRDGVGIDRIKRALEGRKIITP